MAKTRGGHSASPSSPTPRPHRAAMGAAASPPVQAPAIPPSEGKPLLSADTPLGDHPTDPVPPADRAQRPAPRPPAKRTKFSGPGESSHEPQAERPTEEPRIPVGIPPETVIRRPMIAGPPIEGNLDYRDRSFHSETYFDIEALRQQPELRDSFRLLQRPPHPTLIQFTIDGRQGAIGARHIAQALHIPYEPVFLRQTSGSGPHSLRVTWSAFCPGDFYSLVLTRRELPSGMLLIDVLLRANIFPPA
ncbi:hypothetical protein CK203_025068 [Vitis vinifera]|uniref:Uncharacterized protein n=1 Tax=Vitis vinifera TaxID=29760 RepID=A0A438E729_VITVI|nr:hypothetical protein CK203_107094 [Vitis vinifera]RVX04858.1 hypothetical protein CK203_025068 [Vitis vinifera]